MSERTRKALAAAEKAVGRVVQQCRKGGPLYGRSPKAVPQVNRTAKWFLNALAALRRELSATA